MRKLYLVYITPLVLTNVILIRAQQHIRSIQDSPPSSKSKLERAVLAPSSNPKLESKPYLQYAPKFKVKKRLEFLHIAKNAGSAIVHSAAKAGINWGACHFKTCEHTSPDIITNAYRPSIWHLPISELPSNLYGDDAALFAVVRNPYDRCLSKFYYDNRRHTSLGRLMPSINEEDYLNGWIKSNLKAKMDQDIFVSFFFPAYDYVFDKDTGNQVVDYILRYEKLGDDFDQLMKEFSLDITLGKRNARHSSATLGVENLSNESIQIINDYFYNDFIAFGYDMM